MKKVAVLICGQYREFEVAIKSWKFMPVGIDFHFYLSTWNTTYEEMYDCKNTPATPIEQVTTERIHSVAGFKKFQLHPEIRGGSVKRHIFLIKQAIQMIDASEEYSHIIMIRPDLWLHEQLNAGIIDVLKTSIPDDTVFGTSLIRLGHISIRPEAMDCIWITNPNTMKAYLKLDDNESRFGMERILGEFYTLENLTLHVIPGDWRLLVVRSNSRDLTEHTFNAIEKKSIEWWNIKHPENPANEEI
jgi:hypothetical protein